jgi:hypothetical protein
MNRVNSSSLERLKNVFGLLPMRQFFIDNGNRLMSLVKCPGRPFYLLGAAKGSTLDTQYPLHPGNDTSGQKGGASKAAVCPTQRAMKPEP